MGSGGGQLASGTVTGNKIATGPKLSFDELRAALRQVGEERYHHRHPFHLLMHEGKLSRGQLQAWALNRYYYQSIIPIKDAIILSRSTDSNFRRAWRKRIIDHDGSEKAGSDKAGEAKPNGGIVRWIKLAEATGLDRERVERAEGILPATRFIGNEYLNLVRTRPFVECVASSLTELFSRDLIVLRMEKLREHYPWLAERPRLLSGALDRSARGRRLRHRVCLRARRDARRTRGRNSGPARQMRHSVGAARRALLRLCRAWMAAAGSVSDRRRRS